MLIHMQAVCVLHIEGGGAVLAGGGSARGFAVCGAPSVTLHLHHGCCVPHVSCMQERDVKTSWGCWQVKILASMLLLRGFQLMRCLERPLSSWN